MRDLNDMELNNILKIEKKKAIIAKSAFNDLNFLDLNFLTMSSEELNDFFREILVKKISLTVSDSQ